MKKLIFLMVALLTACTSPQGKKGSSVTAAFIDENRVSSTVEKLREIYPEADMNLAGKGVRHAASLWRTEDGSAEEFSSFVESSFIADPAKRKSVFIKLSDYFESLNGNMNEITLDLKKVLDEKGEEIDDIDRMFGNYSVGSHIQSDFFANKIAFVVALNFPYYTLAEKEELGREWSREEWAMARMGDFFVARVPAELNQALATAGGNADMYIAEYNICMGHLLTEDGQRLFPMDKVLLSHWNLRDEIKANYADRENGHTRQEMIYTVMDRIIRQEIPAMVINNPSYDWAPYSNKVTADGAEINAVAEDNIRYKCIIDNFVAMKALDPYYPGMNTAILRKFSGEMEIAQEEVEELFDSYLLSPQLKQLAEIIRERLGRDLEPFDIWYDGFKSRSSIPEDLLTSKTSSLYPDPEAFRAGMPEMLRKLGWSDKRAKYIADKIVVDPARGSGHAWGAGMKGSVSHLRTRISDKGMDYKGYNIAVHEFGHNVEQTISLYDVDYYTMSGVPNTGFTEAAAFMFQSRDLMLLQMSGKNAAREKTDTFDMAWSLMEIMGVGMVDMQIWKWLYENPGATPEQLKEQTINIAVGVWNKYFAPVLGVSDSPILAIYSHIINSPLYLANYSYGQIIEFQIEEFISDKNFADEFDRIYSLGRLTPQMWMTQAVGSKLSVQPMINALDEALK